MNKEKKTIKITTFFELQASLSFNNITIDGFLLVCSDDNKQIFFNKVNKVYIQTKKTSIRLEKCFDFRHVLHILNL